MIATRLLFLLLFLPLASHADICRQTKSINTDAYKDEIGSRKVTFIAIDFKNNECWAINQSGLEERHSPYSTFKIPHTLIALETKAVTSIDERIEWDQIKYPAQSWWPETWKRSQTLATAFKHSAVWYYQELVPRIKPEQYKEWLSRFHYGNQTFTSGSNNYWLNGELTISPSEQIKFITCLVKTRCGVRPSTLTTFESAALQETKNNLFLYAKTGTGPKDPENFNGAFEGWYVGYVRDEDGKPITAFAIFVEAESFSALQTFRRNFALRMLIELKLWI